MFESGNWPCNAYFFMKKEEQRQGVLETTQKRIDRALMKHYINRELETEGKNRKARKNQESKKELYLRGLLAQEILQIIDAAVITTDLSGKVLFLNQPAEMLTGWTSLDAYSQSLSHIFKIVSEVTSVSLEDLVKKALYEDQVSCFSGNAFLISSNEDLIPIEYFISPIYLSRRIVGTTLIFRDRTFSYKITSQKSWPSDRDSLTGLLSRSSFENHLEQVLQLIKASDQIHILCHLDLDRFKIINEVYGHLAGDEFLRQFSAVLQKRIRKTDILARLGGDEFGLILQHCNVDQALSVLKILHEEVRKFRFSWQDQLFNVTFTTGVTLLHSRSGNSSDVLIEADSACTIAKSKGRDRVQVYQANDQDITAQRGVTKGVLRVIKALEEDQFLLYCQPIVPITHENSSDDQYYYEVLIRLQDDQGNIILPNDFLPAAEQYGLMHLVDRWVIRSLFKTLTQNGKNNNRILCRDSFQDSQKYCYSINLSGSSFNDDQFLDFVQEQFSLYLIPPESICFEITETVAIANLSKAAKFIAQLREIGCRFALDDFGSGMSSFGYLKTLPIDYIKIDGNFVKEILQNSIAYEIVKSINSIGHAMKVQTTAEFVENEEILSILRTIGVDYVQGYGIAKPFPLKSS